MERTQPMSPHERHMIRARLLAMSVTYLIADPEGQRQIAPWVEAARPLIVACSLAEQRGDERALAQAESAVERHCEAFERLLASMSDAAMRMN